MVLSLWTETKNNVKEFFMLFIIPDLHYSENEMKQITWLLDNNISVFL